MNYGIGNSMLIGMMWIGFNKTSSTSITRTIYWSSDTCTDFYGGNGSISFLFLKNLQNNWTVSTSSDNITLNNRNIGPYVHNYYSAIIPFWIQSQGPKQLNILQVNYPSNTSMSIVFNNGSSVGNYRGLLFVLGLDRA